MAKTDEARISTRMDCFTRRYGASSVLSTSEKDYGTRRPDASAM